MKAIRTNAEAILKEQYLNHVSRFEEQLGEDMPPYTMQEWCENESFSDPDFYRWIFDDYDISDFGSNLTEEELQVVEEFISYLY